MKTLVILGNDKISYALVANKALAEDHIKVIFDTSTNAKRAFLLIIKKRMNPILLLRMFLCECARRAPKDVNIGEGYETIKNNSDINNIITEFKPDRVLLFRAGLIINKSVIELGIPLLNIHCAKLPGYAGLGVIWRALKAKDVSQCATLHRVLETIDTGEVLDTESYELDLAASYCENENIAYRAGENLLLRTLETNQA